MILHLLTILSIFGGAATIGAAIGNSVTAEPTVEKPTVAEKTEVQNQDAKFKEWKTRLQQGEGITKEIALGEPEIFKKLLGEQVYNQLVNSTPEQRKAPQKKDAHEDCGPTENGKTTPTATDVEVSQKLESAGWKKASNAEDIKKAEFEANAAGKTLWLYFSGTGWCGWTKKFNDQLANKPELQERLKSDVVGYYLDFPRNGNPDLQPVAQKYGVNGYPTVIGLKNGKITRSGFKSSTQEFLDEIDGKSQPKVVNKKPEVNPRSDTQILLGLADKNKNGTLEPNEIASLLDLVSETLKNNQAKPSATENTQKATTQPLAGKQINNQEDLDNLIKNAKKPVALYFSGSDWCRWTKNMDGEILSDPSVQKYLTENFEIGLLDMPRSGGTETVTAWRKGKQQEYGIRGVPTFLILEEGKPNKTKGYSKDGPTGFIKSLQD